MKHFFDISGVAWYFRRKTGFTGIQRAVAMLIEHAAQDLGPEGVWISFWSPARRSYRAVPYAGLAPGTLTDPVALRGVLGLAGATGGAAHPALRGYRGKPLKLWYHAMWMRLQAALGNEAHFRRRNTTLAGWRAFRDARTTSVASVGFAGLARPGDHLILLDSTFRLSRATAAFRRAHADGLTVHTMVHDLIPVVAPQFCQGALPLNFHDWLRATGGYTSAYLANSQATGRDLSRFLGTYGIARPVRVVPLAQAGLPEPPPAAGHGRAPLLDLVDAAAYPDLFAGAAVDDRVRALARQPYVLCVGTLEVRKNIWKIAQAWDRLRQMTGVEVPKLVFAGRRGWLIEDFSGFMAATGNLHGWVEIIEGPSDGDLDYLYRNCLFSIMASFYEGWGLPIGESLACGKTAVVADTSSMPEVGGDMVEYCDPQSVDSITAACARLITDPARRQELERRIAATRLRGWQDVAADLVAALRLPPMTAVPDRSVTAAIAGAGVAGAGVAGAVAGAVAAGDSRFG